MLIRTVKESELPDLLALLRGQAEFDGCPEMLRATVDSLRDALFRPTPLAHALVAEVDAKIVGMATYYATFSSFLAKPGLWLDDLFVLDSYRGRGIGEELMKNLCALAELGGCCRVDWLVSASNERGKQFYRRIGASISEKAMLVRFGEDQIHALSSSEA